jgi:LysM repeat protein
VPASITLAKGLLESRHGLSELAVKGNNHFGIKCHNNWTGKKIYYDDDAKGECFRKYPSPEQSYRDHSDFLRYRDRYKFLFDYKTTDYKSWANGLKKAGYATDPSYASKLIRIIEDYRLYEYDDKPASFAKSDRKSKKESKRVTVKVPDVLPPSPTEIEQAEALTEAQRQDFHFSISREVYKRNGVPFVKAMEGESYSSIASANNLFLREILKYNDLAAEAQIAPGTEVYLRPKKGQAVKGLDKHVVEEGETMRSIAQRYGVRLKNLYKINEMADGSIIREGDIIKLRK